jgi:mRNA interferase RelE/StbE
MNWIVKFELDAENDLNKLDRQIQIRISKFIQRLIISKNPTYLGEQLRGNLSRFWKYRVSDYRLICDLDYKKSEVSILKISHRKNIYKSK